MSLPEYLLGALSLAFTITVALSVGALVVRKAVASGSIATRIAGFGVSAGAVLVLVHLLPAAMGVLNRETVALTTALVAAAALRMGLCAALRDTFRGSIRLSADRTAPRLLVAIGVGAVAVYITAALQAFAAAPITSVDAATFHLPGVARWVQSETVWQINQFVPDQAHGYYPGNGNLAQLAVVLPWKSDFLVRAAGVPFLGLMAVATYGMGRELGAARLVAAATATATLAMPAVLDHVILDPTPDAFMYGNFAAGALFLLRHVRTRARMDLILAGVGLGLAFGSRWYGVSAVAVVIAVWLVGGLLQRHRDERPLLGEMAVLVGVAAAAGGFWLVRNLVESGNPLFPASIEIAGVTVFGSPDDPIRSALGHTVFEYLNQPGVVVDYIGPALIETLALPGALLGLAALVALPVSVRLARRRGPSDAASRFQAQRALAVACGCLLVALAYSLTPYSALGPADQPAQTSVNTRYLVPALVLAAPVAAWMLSLTGRLSWRRALHVAALLAVLDGVRRAAPLSLPAWLAGAGLVTVMAMVSVLLLRRSRDGTRHPWHAPTLATCAVVAVVAAGFALQKVFIEGRYRGEFATVDRVLANGSGGLRIGVAGAWDLRGFQPILPLFGPRLENDVSYFGEFVDGMLRPYRTRDEYVSALPNSDYDLLFVGKEPLPLGPEPSEERWAAAVGYEEIAEDDRYTLFRAPVRER